MTGRRIAGLAALAMALTPSPALASLPPVDAPPGQTSVSLGGSPLLLCGLDGGLDAPLWGPWRVGVSGYTLQGLDSLALRSFAVRTTYQAGAVGPLRWGGTLSLGYGTMSGLANHGLVGAHVYAVGWDGWWAQPALNVAVVGRGMALRATLGPLLTLVAQTEGEDGRHAETFPGDLRRWVPNVEVAFVLGPGELVVGGGALLGYRALFPPQAQPADEWQPD